MLGEPPPEGTERRGESRRHKADRRRRRSRAELDGFAREVRRLEYQDTESLARAERLEAEGAELERELAEVARGRADAEAALALAQERAEELERQVGELEARGRELEARVAEAGTDAAARVELAERQARAKTARLREQLTEVRTHARRQLREAERRLESPAGAGNGGNGSEGQLADLVALLEDQTHFVEQAGASLWATESELAEMRAGQSVLEAERDEAGRRAQEASERAAQLAVQLRERESAAPS
jgi:chromosome segregation ATPase